MVNEWGTGTSLDVLLTHGGVLGPRRSSWLVAQVASAIASAHAADVSHGRLNPENVLIDRYGAIRLIGLDPLVSAKIVRLANSAAYIRGGQEIRDVRTAVTRLGLRTVRATTMAIEPVSANR